MTVLYVVLGLLALTALAVVLIHNGLVAARNRVDEAWSGIDVQLRRRHDLVPNLVAAVRGYAEHERATLEAVTHARATAMAATSPEQYPELRATENFARLQAELARTEDEIQAARRIYNGNVQTYLTRCQTFPNSIVAANGPFPVRPYFELTDPEREQTAPVVAF